MGTYSALANALIHSNYYDRRGLVIEKTLNEITVFIPGTMRISVDEAISGGVSDPRNSTIMKMFALVGIGERAGSGIYNIHTVLAQNNLEHLILIEQFNPDRTILKVNVEIDMSIYNKSGDIIVGKEDSGDKNDEKTINQRAIIIGFLRENGSGTNSDFSKLLDVKSQRVRDILNELINEDIIIAKGNNKGRVYILK